MEFELVVAESERRAVPVADRLAKFLGNLAFPDRSRRDIGLELRHRALRPSRSHVLKVDPRQHAYAVLHRRRRIDCRDRPLERVTRDIVRHDHHSDVETVEVRTEPRERLDGAEHPPRMAVEIDRRVAGFLNEVRWRDQSRSRAIVEYARRSLLGSHAAARSNLRHAWWT